MTGWHRVFHKFRRSERGATAVTVALMMTVLVTIVGLAVDGIRVFLAKSNLQIALDSAVLAAAASSFANDFELNAVGQKFMAANFRTSSSVSGLSSTITHDMAAYTINGRASATYSTSFLWVIGVNSVSFNAASVASRAQAGPLELVLVLDKTYSMGTEIGGVKKISTLKNAAISLVGSVMGPDTKIGVVSFAGQMTVDATTYADASWIDVGSPVSAKGGCSIQGTDCDVVYYDCTMDGVTRQCPRVENCKVFKKLCSPDKILYWNGCLAYRPGYETSISSPENPKYKGLTIDWGSRCNSSFLDLNSNFNLVKAQISAIYESGDLTYIPGGLLWGWNMLDPEEPLTAAQPNSELLGQGGHKVMVLMTDGANNAYVQSDGTIAAVSTPEQQATTDDATATLCTEIKSEGIALYTVAFDVTDEDILAILRNCASSQDMAFTASNVSALNDAFGTIGTQLKRVHLTR